MSQLAVFMNPAARKGKGAARAATAVASLTGSGGAELIEPASLAELHTRAAEVVAAGVARIVVVGGDGLVHQVLQSVAGTDTVLGIIPVGTGNDFATALGLPRDPLAAAALALGPHRRVDLLHNGASWAASVATVGFSAAVNERAESLRWPRGGARYSVATMLELRRMAPLAYRITLETDNGPVVHNARAALIAVGNTAMFGGGMRICPDAVPDDGLAEITVIETLGRLRLLAHFGRVFRGTHVRHPAVSVYRARAVSLAVDGTDHNRDRHPSANALRADGEAWGTLPARLTVVPRCLNIAAPASR